MQRALGTLPDPWVARFGHDAGRLTPAFVPAISAATTGSYRLFPGTSGPSPGVVWSPVGLAEVSFKCQGK